MRVFEVSAKRNQHGGCLPTSTRSIRPFARDSPGVASRDGSMNAPLEITLISCAVLGFRHGFDYDHIAAISDITSIQQKASNAMRLGLLYALGHAVMIASAGRHRHLISFLFPPGWIYGRSG